jgi:hypothetical protein
MGVFDQAARYLVKRHPEGFFHWLSPSFAASWVFSCWHDTSRMAFPGEPDRICDTVAEFRRIGQPDKRCILDVEFQSEPETHMLERLGEYAIRIRREEEKTGDGSSCPVVSVLLNLTGSTQPNRFEMTVPELDHSGLWLQVLLRTLQEEEAADTLARMGAGQIQLCILPFIPLMRGAIEASILEEWKRLALSEPDPSWRGDYGGLALVFADLAECGSVWRHALEGWNVKQSQQVLEWQNEARREGELTGLRGAVLRALRVRFQKKIPAKLAAAIQGVKDLDELSHWLDAALTAESLDAFRAAIHV